MIWDPNTLHKKYIRDIPGSHFSIYFETKFYIVKTNPCSTLYRSEFFQKFDGHWFKSKIESSFTILYLVKIVISLGIKFIAKLNLCFKWNLNPIEIRDKRFRNEGS